MVNLYDEKSKRSKRAAVKTILKDEVIINMVIWAWIKAERKALLKPVSVSPNQQAKDKF